MTSRQLRAATRAAGLACVWLTIACSQTAEAQIPDRIVRLERWLKAVLHHRPGLEDAPLNEVRSWSNADLRTLWIDTNSLVRVMRDPRQSQFTLRQQGRPVQAIPYTSRQVARLKMLACAAAGLLAEPRFISCTTLKDSGEIDADLRRLNQLAARSRFDGDDNYVLRRGALLHADAAMAGPEPIEALASRSATSRPPPGPERISLRMSDGRDVDLGHGAVHWEIARQLLDAVRPGRDDKVRLWYRTTTVWMQSLDLHDSAHLQHALTMFPDDADLLFLTGCEHEAYARPAIQRVVRGAALPAGIVMDVQSNQGELRLAENFLRRALAANGALVEARVRLGHVLLLRGRHQEAAEALRQAMAAPEDDLLQYYAMLFLGAAEETLAHYDAANAAYADAAKVYPMAQSPGLALSALAWRRGDRSGALREVQRVFDLPHADEERIDPWWTYHTAQGRNADRLLEELRRPFLEAHP